MKYAILHKIGFTNWCPSMHGTGISPALASLLYHIERKEEIDAIYQQLQLSISKTAAFELVPDA